MRVKWCGHNCFLTPTKSSNTGNNLTSAVLLFCYVQVPQLWPYKQVRQHANRGHRCCQPSSHQILQVDRLRSKILCHKVLHDHRGSVIKSKNPNPYSRQNILYSVSANSSRSIFFKNLSSLCTLCQTLKMLAVFFLLTVGVNSNPVSGFRPPSVPIFTQSPLVSLFNWHWIY